MRVLFIGPNLRAGGAERQWSILLPGLRRRGHDARMIALDGGGAFYEPLLRAGVPVEVINMSHQADVGALLRCSLVRGFRPEAIVSRGVNGLYVGQALAALRRSRHIFNDHRQVGLALSRRREAMVRLVARRLELVVTVTAEQAGAWLDRGYPRERIVVVPNGVQTPQVSEARTAIRQSLAIADSAILAVLVAGLRPEKRVTDFVQAIRQARRAHPELIGLIAGDGPERSAVERAADGDAGVRLLGERDDVPRILKAADIFVLASDREAAPMAILEAMATGLPVISTAVGGIGEMVVHGETGMLVAARAPQEMAAKLGELATDGDLRRSLGRAGLARQRGRWDAERMIEGYARILTLPRREPGRGRLTRLTRTRARFPG
jgi:glycosyltransferase involved in cell wall biosynthesis